jgi:glycosyltransferase involved in cell wall biosynthesis
VSEPARVAICVPSYAAERFLAEALDSVLAQTESNWEMVVVDDASVDRSFEIAQEYAAADPRITAIRNPENLGAAASWAVAVAATKAPFVKLLCCDDAIRPDCLERQLAVFDADSSGRVGLVAAQRQLIAEDGTLIRKRHGLMGLKRSAAAIGQRELVTAMLRTGTNPLGEPSTVMFRRTALTEAGGFDPQWRYVIDLKAYVEIAKGYQIALIREPIGVFRVSSSSWSARLARLQSEETRRLFRLAAKDAGIGRLMLWRGIVAARILQTIRRLVTTATRWRARLGRS